ncbi:MAG: hypothetical protein HY539_04450 [Deltaproteobacteria bacterium]|nr:hypothetical protein [Deltaproteobacteria bacterium]
MRFKEYRVLSFLYLFLIASKLLTGEELVNHSLPSWQKGQLDLHHINTGRGNAAFYIFPDGTTMLVDAGDLPTDDPRTLSPRNASIKPNGTKTVYEWLAQYIRAMHPKKDHPTIDYTLLTHFHDDHIGVWAPYRERSKDSNYQLFGITGVGDLLPIKKMIDRSYPKYPMPYDMSDERTRKTMTDYKRFIQHHRRKFGMQVEAFAPGSQKQIRMLRKPEFFPPFQVKIIVGNGIAWTGMGEETFQVVNENPNENSLSLGIRISYGPFSYFTGGDLFGVTSTGETDENSVESRIAPIIGPVDVATLNHHGNRDSQNSFYVKTLRPRVWIQQNWSSDHPGEEVLRRITSTSLYPGERDLFALNMLEATRQYIGPLIDHSYKSTSGHVVVRVANGGKTYQIFVLDDSDTTYLIKAIFGPYSS